MKKSNPTVKQAVVQAYESLPDEFRGNDLHRLVKMITRRRFIHTDTSLRKLRVLRSEGKLDYHYVGAKDESKYQKA